MWMRKGFGGWHRRSGLFPESSAGGRWYGAAEKCLFSGTIEENLQWGDENADKDQIRAAAESAQAEGFIQKLADGYDTELGQGGVNVSGGQKQRLCIARALLKRPKILILDDSTSAVDTATEARIREAFSTTLKETTKLIIAQRIGSVMEADQIIVMDGEKSSGLANMKPFWKPVKPIRKFTTPR